MKKTILKSLVMISLGILSLLVGCDSTVNTNYDSRFTDDGYLIQDTTINKFSLEQPSSIKFFVEVSGSMNGFFRNNIPTHFKTDFWKVLNYFSPISYPVTILTNSGSQGAQYQLSKFQSLMNTGAFISSASTKVPKMLQTIISNIDTEKGEVAILVSDMKYSPVGSAAPNVLLAQYSTDISKILGNFNEAVSLVCATSDYYDKAGNKVCERSPYYYLILGKPEHVADVRNDLSALLEQQSRYVDNIETGFDYGKPRYTFSISNKCDQLEFEPTFINYEEADEIDTCMVRLKINLEDYRWIMTNKDFFIQSFKVKTLYGSQVEVGKIDIKVENITGYNHDLNRKASASVDIKIFNMANDSEVIEWILDIPHTNYTLMNEFLEGAVAEGDPNKSYSVIDFIKGMFYGGIISKDLKPNYILISKKG